MDGLKRLKTGNFNNMQQERLPDGSVKITLSSHGDDTTCIIRVKNLYQPSEEELDVSTGEPIPKTNL